MDKALPSPVDCCTTPRITRDANHNRIRAFTLIELSIALVIIGLLVGGVLVGRDLIVSATVRAQITQIEKCNQAVNAFKGKYNALPGDISDPDATNFGFQPRGQYAGEGDGNGTLAGVWGDGPGRAGGPYQTIGETPMFWVDLSTAKLIDGNFSAAHTNTAPTSLSYNALFPTAKIGTTNYLFALGNYTWWCPGWCNTTNTFALASITGYGSGGSLVTQPGLTVMQAYKIDQKIDDGLPLSGNVEDIAPTGVNSVISLGTSTTFGTATTCNDNNNIAGNVMQYSITQNNGTGVNCALSFRFQ